MESILWMPYNIKKNPYYELEKYKHYHSKETSNKIIRLLNMITFPTAFWKMSTYTEGMMEIAQRWRPALFRCFHYEAINEENE